MADIYDDGGSDTATETPAEEKSTKDEGAATGLLSKSFFGEKELKPGDRCEIELDRVFDDQVQVHKVAESDYKDAKDKDEMMASGPMQDDLMD